MTKLGGSTMTMTAVDESAVRLVRSVEAPAEFEATESTLSEWVADMYPTFAYIEDRFGSPVARLLLAGFGETLEPAVDCFVREFGCPVEALRSANGVVGAEDAGIEGICTPRKRRRTMRIELNLQRNRSAANAHPGCCSASSAACWRWCWPRSFGPLPAAAICLRQRSRARSSFNSSWPKSTAPRRSGGEVEYAVGSGDSRPLGLPEPASAAQGHFLDKNFRRPGKSPAARRTGSDDSPGDRLQRHDSTRYDGRRKDAGRFYRCC